MLPKPLQLRVLLDGRECHLLPLSDLPLTVGAAPFAGLTLAGEGVYPRHLRFKESPPGTLVVEQDDLDAHVFLNGEEVFSAAVTASDRVAFGPYLLVVEPALGVHPSTGRFAAVPDPAGGAGGAADPEDSKATAALSVLPDELPADGRPPPEWRPPETVRPARPPGTPVPPAPAPPAPPAAAAPLVPSATLLGPTDDEDDQATQPISMEHLEAYLASQSSAAVPTSPPPEAPADGTPEPAAAARGGMSPPVEHSAPTELVRGGEALDAYPLHDEEDLRSTGPMPSVPASSSSPSPPPPPPPTPDELAAAAALRAGTPPPTQEELAAAAVQYAETPPPSPTPAAGVDGAPEEIGDEPDADFEDSRWLEAWAEAGFASEWPLGARRHFYGWQAASALVQVTFVVGVVLFAPEPLTRYDLMDDGGLLEERWITSYFVPKKTEEDASAKSEKQRRKKRRDKRTVAQGKKGGEDKGSPGKDKRGGQRRLSRSAKRALERALGLGGAGAGGLPTDLLVGGSVAGAHRFDALARPLGRVGTSTPRGRRARVPGGSILGGRGVRGIGAKDRKAITRGTRDLKPVATRLKVSGSLDRKSIKSTINAKFSRIEHCFERHSRQIKPGRIAFRFTIGVDGTVTGVRATQDKIGYPKLTACLSGVFSAMRFPPPSGGPAEVTYPLVYEQ